MRYRVRVGGREFAVVVRDGAGRATVLVDGRAIEAEMEEAAPGVYSLLIDGRSYDLAASRLHERYTIAVEGVPFDLVVEDERHRRLASAGHAKSLEGNEIAILAPMPGLVVQVDVSEGDRIEGGKRLLVVEAMKMENDIGAPRAARVKQVGVRKGQIVEQGQLLVLLE